MATPKWYVTASGREQGPFTSDQLKEFVAAGKLRPDMPIRKEGMDKTVPASAVKGLFDAAPAAAPPPAAPPPQAAPPQASPVPPPQAAPPPAAPPQAAPPPQAVPVAAPAEEAHEEQAAAAPEEPPAAEPKRQTRSRRRSRGGRGEGTGRTRRGRSSRRARGGDDEDGDDEDPRRRRQKSGGGKGMLIVIVLLLLIGGGGFAAYHFGYLEGLLGGGDIKGTWGLDITPIKESIEKEIEKAGEGPGAEMAKAMMTGMLEMMGKMEVVVDDTHMYLSMGPQAQKLKYEVVSQQGGTFQLKLHPPAGVEDEPQTITVKVSGNRAEIVMTADVKKKMEAQGIKDSPLTFVRKSSSTKPPSGIVEPPDTGTPPDAETPPDTDAPPAKGAPPDTTEKTGEPSADATPPDTTGPPTIKAPPEPPAATVSTAEALSPAECRSKAGEIFVDLQARTGDLIRDSRANFGSGDVTVEKLKSRANGILTRFTHHAGKLRNPGYESDPELKELRDKMLELIGSYKDYLSHCISTGFAAEAAGATRLSADETLKAIAAKQQELSAVIEPLLKGAIPEPE